MTLKYAGLALGLAIAAAVPGTAGAADLYGGSIKDNYVAPAAASPSMYIRIDGGYAVHDDPTMSENGIFHLTDTDIGHAWTLGGGIGRYFNNTLRGDITYDHRFEADAKGSITDPKATLPGVRSFGIESDVVMFNMYYDFNRLGRFSPYVGVGLGVTHNKTTGGHVSDACGCTGTIEEGSSTEAAGALMAGFSAKLRGDQVSSYGGEGGSGRGGVYLDVGYRFLYLGDTTTGEVKMTPTGGGPVVVSEDPTVESIHAHEFRVGLRYDLR